MSYKGNPVVTGKIPADFLSISHRQAEPCLRRQTLDGVWDRKLPDYCQSAACVVAIFMGAAR